MEVWFNWSSSCGDYSDNRKRMQQLVSEPSILGEERRLESRRFDAGITENRRKLESQQSDARWKKNMPLLRNSISSKPGVEVAAADKESSLVEEDDMIVQLRNLKQVSHLRSYIEAFDELNSRAGIEEDQALSIFLSGLLDEIRIPVCLFKPKTLDEAYALAKLQELTINVLRCDREKNLRRNEKLDANSSSYCNTDFEQSECNRSPVQKTEELEPEPAVCPIAEICNDNKGEVSMMEDDSLVEQLSGVETLSTDDVNQNHGVEMLITDEMKQNHGGETLKTDAEEVLIASDVEQNDGVEVFDKNDAMNVDDEDEVEESDVSVVLPISTCCSLSLSWLLNWFPRPMVKMKLMKFASRAGFEEETLNSNVSFSGKNGTDLASAGRVGTDILLGKSIPILEADSHETVAVGKSTGSSSAMKKAYQLSDIDWLMLIWFPQPNVKMKHERLGSGIREAWLHDSLWARNLKGEGLLRSQIAENELRWCRTDELRWCRTDELGAELTSLVPN